MPAQHQETYFRITDVINPMKRRYHDLAKTEDFPGDTLDYSLHFQQQRQVLYIMMSITPHLLHLPQRFSVWFSAGQYPCYYQPNRQQRNPSTRKFKHSFTAEKQFFSLLHSSHIRSGKPKLAVTLCATPLRAIRAHSAVPLPRTNQHLQPLCKVSKTYTNRVSLPKFSISLVLQHERIPTPIKCTALS